MGYLTWFLVHVYILKLWDKFFQLIKIHCIEKQYLQRKIQIMRCFTNVVKFIIECTWEETKKGKKTMQSSVSSVDQYASCGRPILIVRCYSCGFGRMTSPGGHWNRKRTNIYLSLVLDTRKHKLVNMIFEKKLFTK